MSNNDDRHQTFSAYKQKAGKSLGIQTNLVEVPPSATTQQYINIIKHESESADGILVQLPLHNEIDTFSVLNAVPTTKDVEGLGADSVGLLIQDNTQIYSPVAKAALHALMIAEEQLGIKRNTLHTAIVGNSYLIGRPLSAILSRQCRSVTICNRHTDNISEITRSADVIITGTGRPHSITKEMVKNGAILIDAGYEIIDGTITGDIHPDAHRDASFFTPVPGGIGPVTIAYIFDNFMLRMQKYES